MSGAMEVIAVAAVVGCGLSGGALFAFSSFVMAALRRLPPERGSAAMQSINVTAVTPAFMTALFGSGVLCVVLSAWVVADPGGRPVAEVLAGSAAYLAGTLGVTMACNVPLNDRLAALPPGSAEAASYWDRYAGRWTAWNHVRVVAAAAAVVALAMALAS